MICYYRNNIYEILIKSIDCVCTCTCFSESNDNIKKYNYEWYTRQCFPSVIQHSITRKAARVSSLTRIHPNTRVLTIDNRNSYYATLDEIQ